jgi:DNA-binding CsgD family transcriptional regulator
MEFIHDADGCGCRLVNNSRSFAPKRPRELMLEALIELRGQVPFAALLVTARPTPTDSDVPIYSIGMEAAHVAHGLEYFIPRSPEFQVVSETPDEIIDWSGMPSFRETATARDHLILAGYTQGVSLLLRSGERPVGTLHMNVTHTEVFSDTDLAALDRARNEIEAAVTAMIAGTRMSLTPREHEVLALISLGWTNPKIADALQITRRTVATHVENLLSKLHASNRTQAVVRAVELGLLR